MIIQLVTLPTHARIPAAVTSRVASSHWLTKAALWHSLSESFCFAGTETRRLHLFLAFCALRPSVAAWQDVVGSFFIRFNHELCH